jgi:uncharacterized membrane protein YphA (DoxX/SURF4 family)
MATAVQSASFSVATRARTIPAWPFAVLRLYCGIVFVTAGAKQLIGAAPWVSPDARTWAATVQHQLVQWEPRSWWWYRPLLPDVFVPHVSLLAPLVAWSHLILGVALLFGFRTRWTAAIAIALLLNYLAASGGQLYYPGPTAAYLALLLAVLLTSPEQPREIAVGSHPKPAGTPHVGH